MSRCRGARDTVWEGVEGVGGIIWEEDGDWGGMREWENERLWNGYSQGNNE
jgi:hypothetical protein